MRVQTTIAKCRRHIPHHRCCRRLHRRCHERRAKERNDTQSHHIIIQWQRKTVPLVAKLNRKTYVNTLNWVVSKLCVRCTNTIYRTKLTFDVLCVHISLNVCVWIWNLWAVTQCTRVERKHLLSGASEKSYPFTGFWLLKTCCWCAFVESTHNALFRTHTHTKYEWNEGFFFKLIEINTFHAREMAVSVIRYLYGVNSWKLNVI